MASNPLIDQGTLNRLRGTVIVTNSPELNVTASFLDRAGISLALEGETTVQIPTLTGVVQSPEPYQLLAVTIALLKTQSLSNIWKQRMELNSNIGSIVVTPDASSLGTYVGNNCSIQSVSPLTFAGQDAGWVVTVKGVYNINNVLWDLI